MPSSAEESTVEDVPRAGSRWLRTVDRLALALVAVLAVGFRFVTRSPLWLDEALSVNIARLPLGEITEALRHDGHPPLYYGLLHVWMNVFGEGDVAVRALSGLFGLALFPLSWVAGMRLAGRRGAVAAVLVLALSPYAIRYSTETRMYSMVMTLALAAWLLADDAFERPTRGRLVALALLVAALLYTHYWSIWMIGGAGIGLLVHLKRARTAGRVADQRATLRIIGAVVAGGLLFVPWLPVLLYQLSHTGTPWAPPLRPTDVLAVSLVDLGGGPKGEAILLAIVLAILMVVAIFGRAIDAVRIELDLRTRPEARSIVLVVAFALGLGSLVGFVTGSAYASRYLAVLVPLILLLVALGVSRFGGASAFRVVLAVVLLLGAAGGVRNVITHRTQAAQAADAIAADGERAGLVVVCPDQLGPSLARELGPGFDVRTYPRFEAPELVDWVDYTERLEDASPVAFADEALRQAGDRTIWLVWSGTYRTHEGTCEQVLNRILAARPWATTPVVEDSVFFEHMSAWRFPDTAEG